MLLRHNSTTHSKPPPIILLCCKIFESRLSKSRILYYNSSINRAEGFVFFCAYSPSQSQVQKNKKYDTPFTTFATIIAKLRDHHVVTCTIGHDKINSSNISVVLQPTEITMNDYSFAKIQFYYAHRTLVFANFLLTGLRSSSIPSYCTAVVTHVLDEADGVNPYPLLQKCAVSKTRA